MRHAILVTGASRGIGLAATERFLTDNNDFDVVVMVARPSINFDAAVLSTRRLSTRKSVIKIEADLSRIEEIDRIFDVLEQQNINVTGIVNNAGYTNPQNIDDIEIKDFEQTLKTNLVAPFRLVQLAMRNGHALETVLNIASTAGMNGRAGWLTYSASKAALINMSEVMRDELDEHGINVVSISPGRCATDLRKTLAPDENPETIMQPEEVADTIAMLFSPTGRMLEAQNLVVRTKTKTNEMIKAIKTAEVMPWREISG